MENRQSRICLKTTYSETKRIQYTQKRHKRYSWYNAFQPEFKQETSKYYVSQYQINKIFIYRDITGMVQCLFWNTRGSCYSRDWFLKFAPISKWVPSCGVSVYIKKTIHLTHIDVLLRSWFSHNFIYNNMSGITFCHISPNIKTPITTCGADIIVWTWTLIDWFPSNCRHKIPCVIASLADASTQWCSSGDHVLICIIGTHWKTTGKPLEDHWKTTGSTLATNYSFSSGIPVYTGA